MEAQYKKFLDMIRAVRINVPLIDVLAGMPNYRKFLKELISNKHKIERILAAFLSDESSAMIQNKFPPKLGDPRSFLIPCNFKTFSCNALVDLDASINLMPYSLYAKLSLEPLKPTKMSVRLADRSFQCPVGIAENMLIEVEPPTDLELKPLPDNLEYVFLEEPSFLPVIISSKLSALNKSKLVSILKNINKPLPGKQQTFLVSAHHSVNTRYNSWMTRNQLSKNKEATFQRCMLAIFHDMIEESVEVFMDDFSVFGDSFDKCLNNLDKMLQRCKDAHLVLNWEKCHFMVKEGIVLGHKVSSAGLEVDKAKIDVISKLPPPTNIKGIRSFLGHAGFYRRFIKDFSKIARPLTKLLEKDTPFEFDDECQKAFELLKEKLTCAPVIVSPNWNLLFEIMCDASDFAVEAVLDTILPFRMPKALISDRATHFCNKIMEKTMKRYGVNHRFSTTYHPQTSGQVENTNRALKRILEKTVKDNPAIWLRKLDDALWAFHTVYKTPTGTTP
ncbi:reverse transcriptase domain-containing protein [Tanacetum coccineum]